MPGEARSGMASRALEELGLVSLYKAPADVKLLCLQRFVRLFAYGASTLILVTYLKSLATSETRIGLFMTLTLAGDIAISFFLTLFADALGRKAILVLGAALMTAAGAVFALSGNFWVMLAAAVVGIISPSGNEIGPFAAIEASIISHLTAPEHRGDVFAWYGLGGSAGTACGMITAGWVLHHFIEDLAWGHVQSYRAVYYLYAALGVVKLILALLLSPAVESEKKQKQDRPQNGQTETAPLLTDGSSPEAESSQQPKKGLRALLPDMGQGSLAVVVHLSLLFALDSFASGLASMSWITFFFHTRYNVKEGTLGSVFFVTNIIAAASMLLASSLAKRFGNINTMVFTHLPSSVMLSLLGVPNNVHVSLVFLVLRACTQSMDSAPRAAFLATMIRPAERTAVLGAMNVIKTCSQTTAPLVTGVLADKGHLWVAFVCAGALKVCYDLGLLAAFKTKERERADEERQMLEGERQATADGNR